MKWIIKMFDKYYLRNFENSIEEIYLLYDATIFNTKKEAQQVLDDFCYVEECKIIKYKDEFEIFKKYFDEGMIRRSFKKINKTFSRKYNPKIDTIKDVINFFIFHADNENEIRYEDYTTWPYLDLITKTFFSYEGYHNEKYTELYHSFRIAINKKVTFKDFKKEFNLFKKYITYIKDEFLILSIMDNGLSEFDSRYLHYKDDNTCKIVGNYGKLFSGTLKECFENIQRKFYYDND